MVNYDAVISRLRHEGYQAELLLVGTRELVLELDAGGTVFSRDSTTAGYRLEVIKDGRDGVATSNTCDRDLVERAIRASRVSDIDKYRGLPGASVGRSNVNLKFKLADEIGRAKQAFLDLIDVHGMDLEGAIEQTADVRKRVLSTEGVDVEEKRSVVNMGILVAPSGKAGKLAPEVSEDASSTTFNINPREIKDSVTRKLAAIDRRVKNDRKYDEVVLTSRAAVDLLAFLVSNAISGENLYRNRTPFRTGLDIGNPSVSITDNPSVEYSPYSRTFDSSGQRKSPVELLREGKVRNFLYDEYWSRRAGVKSTASADGISNLVINAKEERDVTQDVLVVETIQGVEGQDAATGRFSVNAATAWRNFGGKTQGVRDVIVSGDLLSLLRGIESTSVKKRIDGGVVVGDLRVKGLSVG